MLILRGWFLGGRPQDLKHEPKMLKIVLTALALAPCAAIKVGDKLPAVDIDWGFPPETVNMGAWTTGKTSIIVGLPGAFTPT
mgnify:FL=1